RAGLCVARRRGACAQGEAGSHAGGVVGPAIGGVLYGLGLLAPYLAMAASVAAAWVFALAAKVPRRPGEEVEAAEEGAGPAADGEVADGGAPPRRRGMLAESWEALRWLIGRRGLREMSLVIMAMNFFGGGVTLALIVHIGSLGGSATLTGLDRKSTRLNSSHVSI